MPGCIQVSLIFALCYESERKKAPITPGLFCVQILHLSGSRSCHPD